MVSDFNTPARQQQRARLSLPLLESFFPLSIEWPVMKN